MDTTAAAELGLGDLDSGGDSGGGGVAFWHSPPAGSDHWGNPGDSTLLDDDGDDDALDRSALPVAASPDIPPASPSGFARTRASTAEPPTKLLRSMPDGGGLGFSGHGAGPPSGRGHSSAGSAQFGGGVGGVGSSPSGAGAVGRGRGMGSIFYKTKLCSRFRSGNCPYNSNCNFAHGMEELRKPPPGWEEFVASQELPPPPSQSGGAGSSGAAAGPTDSQVRFHKTRPCKKYFGEGNCPYGEKCNFLHDEQSVPRAVREAREAAVAANSGGGVVAASPRVETPLAPANNDHLKETGAGGDSTSAGSAPPNARPSNWKTRLCNKWETTGHCPFGEKCHFAHGSDAEWRTMSTSWGMRYVMHACLPVVLSISLMYLQSCKGTEEGCQIQICLLFLTRNQEVQLHETRLRCPGSKDIKAELLLRGLARREIPPGEAQVTFRQFMETGGGRMTTGSPGDRARARKALNWKLMYGERRRGAHLFRHPFCQPQEQFRFSGALIAWSLLGRLLSLINGCARISEQDEALQREHDWRIELRELLFRPICTQLVSDIP